jgi:transcription termination factor Rho
LLSEEELKGAYKLRKVLSNTQDATDKLIEMMKKTKDNADLISKLDAWLKIYNS